VSRSEDRAERQRQHFKGKTAIVTGGASGIGRALATELVVRGATVLVADLDGAGAAVVAEGLRHDVTGLGRAIPVALDVTDAAEVAACVATFEDEHGDVDFMFNNAGIGIGGEVKDLTVAHWQRALDVNVMSVVHGVSAVYPGMVRRRGGHIVNTASLGGLIPDPLLAPYGMTKHAVVGLSVSLRSEAANYGVRVSVVCPGTIDTPLLDQGDPVDLAPVPSMPDMRAMLSDLAGKPYPPLDLARYVLDQVALDRPIIVAPKRARALWLAYRAMPNLVIRQLPKRTAKYLDK
jgi:NAD(P)-dependent dehydrogenase (short-subunit alcohol dehydrogenase family)